MTKRDEAVFEKAFKKMEAKGYFEGLRTKAKARTQAKTKTTALKDAKKPRQRVAADSISSVRSRSKAPLAAHKR